MKKEKKIVVVGSSNTDMTIKVDHLPLPGETIIGHDFMTNQGGKGANQAVAVARLGGDTVFVARLGDDSFGAETLHHLKAEGMDTTYVKLTPGASSGVALIPVDAKGENNIIVASGANALLSVADIKEAEAEIKNAGILLMQLETPISTLEYAAQTAHAAGVKVVLNPAPFPKDGLPTEFLKDVDIITPNETEAAAMSGITISDEATALQAIQKIQATGVETVIITVGKLGAYTSIDGKLVRVPTFEAKAVDTVAAGDTFCGGFCVALNKGFSLIDAIRTGNKAASIAVTRIGAQQSVPKAKEVF